MSHIAVYFYILNTQYQQLDVRLQRMDGIVEKENIQWQHFQNLKRQTHSWIFFSIVSLLPYKITVLTVVHVLLLPLWLAIRVMPKGYSNYNLSIFCNFYQGSHFQKLTSSLAIFPYFLRFSQISDTQS